MARVFYLKRVNPRSLGGRRPEVEFRQNYHEGGLVGRVRQGADSDCMIANPAAGTYYSSSAIHDILEAVSVPKVEVRLSNTHPREEVWRHTSTIFPVVDALVGGMGVYGYRAAAGYEPSVGPSGL